MERFENQKKENNVIPSYMLIVIPSWSELLGHPTLGTYVNQKVAKIISDPVIFLSGAEYSYSTESGTIYHLFGLGYYYLKFEIETGTSQLQYDKYIIDNRQLTCLVLSDFVYDHIATARNITLEDDRDVVINDYIFKIPLNLSHKTENQITFMKGVLMRNLFIPYKDIIIEMMDTIRKHDSYQLNSIGHMLLTTNQDSYNTILVSEKMKTSYARKYLEPTAGLNEIRFGADQYLNHFLTFENNKTIENIINNLKNVYSKLTFDPMYLYSILENAYLYLKTEIPSLKSSYIEATSSKSKASILLSAEKNLNLTVSWPNEFKRKKKEEVELKFSKEKQPLISGVKLYEPNASEISSYTPTVSLIDKQKELEDFELRIKKSENVQTKSLPIPPQGDPEKILLYIKDIIEENYDMKSFSIACGLARDKLRDIMLQSDYMWELSKYERIYQTKPANMSLPPKDKEDLLHKINSWLYKFEQDRIEKERLEKERQEAEKLERERLEKERIENERREREKIERLKLEKERERLEEERKETEKITKLREEQEQIRRERERIKLEEEEKEKLRQKQLKEEKEMEERIRQKKQKLEQERLEREKIQKEKRELKRLKRERKQLKKQEKDKKKREKKLLNLQKKKEKQQEKLKKL